MRERPGRSAREDHREMLARIARVEESTARLERGQKRLSAAQSRLEATIVTGETSWPWDALKKRRKFRKAIQVKFAVDYWVEHGGTLKDACAVAIVKRPSGYKTAGDLYAYCNKPWRREAFNAYRKNRLMR